MGAKSKLQAARQGLGWSQAELIDALIAAASRLGGDSPTPSSWKTLVSMYENGRRPVSPEHRLLFREVYQATDEQLGFPQSAAVPDPATPPPPTLLRSKLPVPVNPEMLEYLTSVLGQHAEAEPLVGPQFLVAPVQAQVPLIEQMCLEAYGPLRERVLQLGARYTEFLGWLYQDTGNSDAAMKWTSQAMDYAQELNDSSLVAYSFQRRSNIATEAGYAGHGAGLATAALRYAPDLSPRVRAVVLRQLANSKASLGEHAEAMRAIDQALEAAALGDDADPMAGYCSVAYVEMEGANCDLRLERPENAVGTFTESLTHWPTVQERDRGLCLARLATAKATLGDVEGSHTAARQALGIAERTGSARIRDELLRLRSRLAPWRKLVEISELNRALDNLNRAIASSNEGVP
ncbi:helix-turn-helix domain-containing protein [Streptomyces boncukensis]|uniref:Helix-turn-helix transcriptional regulator n=1 Tax=Streptomyces boncukensis TaxID=2711219 RepID=A0A6G4WRB0_9ACTN|nr:helix-turn-helix transcriptional regulator [Streptomyces boncukensis]NGO67031.1 helix-turn-helix transcriptional regulator [Streptomyces boncukensis]